MNCKLVCKENSIQPVFQFPRRKISIDYVGALAVSGMTIIEAATQKNKSAISGV
jgi:hypothetical protein